MGDVSGNSENSAVHETVDDGVSNDHWIVPRETQNGNPQTEKTGCEEIMNDAFRDLITKTNKEKKVKCKVYDQNELNYHYPVKTQMIKSMSQELVLKSINKSML